jgi:hypothetical protein
VDTHGNRNLKERLAVISNVEGCRDVEVKTSRTRVGAGGEEEGEGEDDCNLEGAGDGKGDERWDGC